MFRQGCFWLSFSVFVSVQVTAVCPDVAPILVAFAAVAVKVVPVAIDVPLLAPGCSEIVVPVNAIAIDVAPVGANIAPLPGSILQIAVAHVLAVFCSIPSDIPSVGIDVIRL